MATLNPFDYNPKLVLCMQAGMALEHLPPMLFTLPRLLSLNASRNKLQVSCGTTTTKPETRNTLSAVPPGLLLLPPPFLPHLHASVAQRVVSAAARSVVSMVRCALSTKHLKSKRKTPCLSRCLKLLSLRFNRCARLPPPIQKMTQATSHSSFYSCVSVVIPFFLRSSLTSLDIGHNLLTALPTWLGLLPRFALSPKTKALNPNPNCVKVCHIFIKPVSEDCLCCGRMDAS